MTFLRFIPETTNVDFVGLRYYAFAIDGLLLIASIVSILFQGFNLGIDFTGGVLMEVKAAYTINIPELRSQVDGLDFGEAQIQFVGGGQCDSPVNSCALIRVQPKAAQSGSVVIQEIKAKPLSSAMRRTSARRSARSCSMMAFWRQFPTVVMIACMSPSGSNGNMASGPLLPRATMCS